MKIISLVMSVVIMIGVFLYSLTPIFDMRSEILTDVSYGDSELENMDIYIPKSAKKRGSAACILFIHGGSWSGGDKSGGKIFCRTLASLGYVTASVNYTLYTAENEGTLRLDTIIDEIDASLAKLRDMTAERGIALTDAATAGYSAGAHLAMLYAYSRAGSSPVPLKFTASMVGPADFSEEIWGESGVRLAAKFTATEITDEMRADGTLDSLIAEISPVSYISAASVPTLLAYGGKDKLVSAENGESVKRALDAAGVRCDLILFPQSGHSLSLNPGKFAKYFGMLRQYAKTYFGY